MFQGSFKRKDFGSLLKAKDASRKFHKSFKGVSSNIDQCFEVDLRVFQGSFKGISSVFKRSFRSVSSVSRKFKVLEQSFKGVK